VKGRREEKEEGKRGRGGKKNIKEKWKVKKLRSDIKKKAPKGTMTV